MSAISDKIADLQVKVETLTTVSASAIALLDTIAGLIRDNANAPTALQELADKIQTDSAALADAVTRNTPAA